MPGTTGYYGPNREDLVKLSEIFIENPRYKRVYDAFMNEDSGIMGSSYDLGMRMAQRGLPHQRFLEWYKKQKEAEELESRSRQVYRYRDAYQMAKGT